MSVSDSSGVGVRQNSFVFECFPITATAIVQRLNLPTTLFWFLSTYIISTHPDYFTYTQSAEFTAGWSSLLEVSTNFEYLRKKKTLWNTLHSRLPGCLSRGHTPAPHKPELDRRWNALQIECGTESRGRELQPAPVLIVSESHPNCSPSTTPVLIRGVCTVG